MGEEWKHEGYEWYTALFEYGAAIEEDICGELISDAASRRSSDPS